MGNSDVCVGCLVTDVKMHSMRSSGLLTPYRQLTGLQELNQCNMSDKLCWECAGLMNKFNKFRLKCERARTLLQRTFMVHGEETLEAIKKIDRIEYGLSSHLCTLGMNVYIIVKETDFKEDKALIINEMNGGDNFNDYKFSNEHQKERKIKRLSDQNQEYDEDFIKNYDGHKEKVYFSTEICDDNFDIKDEAGLKTKNGAANYIQKLDVPDDSELNEDYENIVAMPVLNKFDDKEKIIKLKKISCKKKSLRKTLKVMAKDFGMLEESLTQDQLRQMMFDRQNSDSYMKSSYKCDMCSRTFKDPNAYNNHSMLHDPLSGEFVCDICKLRYKTRKKITVHISSRHSKKYTCLACSEVFYNRITAQKHYAWHRGVVYTCHICGASFRKCTSHQNHLRNKHASGQVCGECGLAFVSEKGLQQHCAMMHSLKRDIAQIADRSGPHCDICGVRFASREAWTKHILTSPRHVEHKSQISNGCNICGKTFDDRNSLREHRRSHRTLPSAENRKSLTPLECEECGEVVTSRLEYQAHFRRSHPGKVPRRAEIKSPVVCELCGKIFRTKMHLRLHTYVHTGERPFKCSVCDKGFNTPYNLQVHVRIHTKELPYLCNICGQEFSNKSNMNRHRRAHSGEKPYKCETCTKSFNNSTKLSIHKRVHTKELPYLCTICGQGFANKSNMNRHKTVHTDAKPYSCEVCGKNFKSRPYLREHASYAHANTPRRERRKKSA